MTNIRLAEATTDRTILLRLLELIAADLHHMECVDLNSLGREQQVDLLLQRDLHEHELAILERRLGLEHAISA